LQVARLGMDQYLAKLSKDVVYESTTEDQTDYPRNNGKQGHASAGSVAQDVT
jgi:hypothetical protein